jgi:pyruvate/2-oxoglutarate/acetoin dehydrogenase E1 component
MQPKCVRWQEDSLMCLLFSWSNCFSWTRCNSLSSIEKLVCTNTGLKVIVPSNVYDAKGLLKSAIRDNDPWFSWNQSKCIKGEVPDGEYTIPIGVAILNVKELMLLLFLWKNYKRSLYAAEVAKEEFHVRLSIWEPCVLWITKICFR